MFIFNFMQFPKQILGRMQWSLGGGGGAKFANLVIYFTFHAIYNTQSTKLFMGGITKNCVCVGGILPTYRLDVCFWAIFEPTPTWPNLNFGQRFMCMDGGGGQIMTRYDFLGARWVILDE